MSTVDTDRIEFAIQSLENGCSTSEFRYSDEENIEILIAELRRLQKRDTDAFPLIEAAATETCREFDMWYSCSECGSISLNRIGGRDCAPDCKRRLWLEGAV